MNTIYVKIRKDWLIVRRVEQKKEYQDVPIIATNGKKGFLDRRVKVFAVGRHALNYWESGYLQIRAQAIKAEGLMVNESIIDSLHIENSVIY